jgi:hypothetical protein
MEDGEVLRGMGVADCGKGCWLPGVKAGELGGAGVAAVGEARTGGGVAAEGSKEQLQFLVLPFIAGSTDA